MPTSSPRLTSLKLFTGLSVEALHPLEESAILIRYADRQLIMLEGDTDTRVFFVLEGSVRAFRTNAEGREQTLALLEAGDAFNLPTVFADGHVTPATAQALGPVAALVIEGDDFQRITSQTPAIALAVLRDLSTKLHHFTTLTHDLSLRSVRARLAGFLLAHMNGAQDSPAAWTQEEIAAQIGTVREVVSRTLRAFTREGLIVMQRQRITVLDAERLQAEADS